MISTVFYKHQILFISQRQIMQAKLAKSGFTNTMSGKMNVKSSQASHKLIDLDDFDVQMLSPHFLQAKTLKKPFKQYDFHLQKTNPNGIQLQFNNNLPPSKIDIQVTSSNRANKQRTQPPTRDNYKFVSGSGLNIQPAYTSKPLFAHQPALTQPANQLQLKDKNSIISALFKKGQLKTSVPIQIKILKPQAQKNVSGPAENKLKILFNKNSNTAQLSVEKSKKQKESRIGEDNIDEEIDQSIEQDYEQQQFEKLSGAAESQIRESIRQSIARSSAIKQSIRQDIPQASLLSAKSKAKSDIKQQIMQSIPKSKQSIEQEVYQQIFEQMSLSDELTKSKNNRNSLKVSKVEEKDKFQLSVSASKGFRTKTNAVVKSIKFADEINYQNQIKSIDSKMQDKIEKNDKLATEIMRQKTQISKLQQKISSILDYNPKNAKKQENKNLDLLYNFRIEVNRLITSENFMSKLRKLTSFMGDGKKSSQDVTILEDKLLGNIMQKIQHLRNSGVSQSELIDAKVQFDEKLNIMLKQQEMRLKMEMERKLFEKDLQLKKMVAELEQKFMKQIRNAAPQQQFPAKQILTDRVQVDSDYSIDSDNVQWKMDLWDLLPDFQKKKLYEKQSAEVAKFLTDVLIKEIKNQSLDRSADISFQFPEQYNNDSSDFKNEVRTKEQQFITQQIDNSKQKAKKDESIKKQVPKVSDKHELFPPLPGMKTKSAQQHTGSIYNIGYFEMPMVKGNENQIRDTLSVNEVIKILSKYKNQFLKKKNDLIRKLVKTLQLKTKQGEPMSSLINQLRILNNKQIETGDEPFVKAYEQELIMQMISIYNHMKNRKNSSIEEEMKKLYDRLVVTCQVKTAEASVGFPSQIAPNQTYLNLRMNQQDKKVKDQIVHQILNILTAEFAKEMPKRK